MTSVNEKVINHLNEILGDDIKSTQKLLEVYDKFQNEKGHIEKMLSLASSEVPSKFSDAVQKVDHVNEKIGQLVNKASSLQVSVEKIVKSREPIIVLVEDKLQDIKTLEHTILYLKQVDNIQNWRNNSFLVSGAVRLITHILYFEQTVLTTLCLDSQLEEALSEKADIRCITIFRKLVVLSEQLQSSQSIHLFAYLHETVLFWYNVLKERFSLEFKEVAKAANWPVLNDNALTGLPSSDSIPRLQSLAQYLLQLQLPEDVYQRHLVDSAVLTDAQPLSPPIALLLRPLRARFLYHFCRPDKETSRPDKPEWCFTKVLKWIQDNCQLVDQWIQPVMDRLGMAESSAKIEFIRGLCQMVAGKLHAELPQLQFDDALFSHTVDETLALARELRDSYGYEENTLLTVLTKASLFQRWLHLERKFALEKMDSLLSSGTAWEPLTSGDEDELKRTECAHGFLTLLSCITERYSILPEPGHRLQFVSLQLDLIDDFRVQLLQLLREESGEALSSRARLPSILNSANYVAMVLGEWNGNLHFLQLQVYQERMRNRDVTTVTEGIFDASLRLLEGMRDDLLQKICDKTLKDIRAHSDAYCKDRWNAMRSVEESEPALTPSACDLFRLLADLLLALQSRLALPLFTKAWTWIAGQLNQLLFKELVQKHYFNEGGANQFQLDVVRNLLPLFGQMTPTPEAYFPHLRESCILLTTPQDKALQLKSSLQNPVGKEDRKLLKDLGILVLSKSEILGILNRRRDLMNTFDIDDLM